MKKRAVIQLTGNADYPYNVQQWIKVEKGVYCYCGVGKFCKTLKEARQEKKSFEKTE